MVYDNRRRQINNNILMYRMACYHSLHACTNIYYDLGFSQIVLCYDVLMFWNTEQGLLSSKSVHTGFANDVITRMSQRGR